LDQDTPGVLGAISAHAAGIAFPDFEHLTGEYVHDYRPHKFTVIEGQWHDEQPASEVLIAFPDIKLGTSNYAITIPVLGSLIRSMNLDPQEVSQKTGLRPSSRSSHSG
jgi:cytochrome d ubiquinol oxidase subunit I